MGGNGNIIDPITAIQARIADMSDAEKLQFQQETGVDVSAIQIMKYEIAMKYCKSHNISLNNIWTQWQTPNTNYSTNPIKGLGIEREQPSDDKLLTKQDLYIRLSDVKNPELANEIENILQGGTPSQEFIDLLLERYEKKQEEFEIAWARYQEAKGERATLKQTLETIQKRYANSESDFENGLVKKAEKNYKTADLDADILLSIASYLAHRVV